MNVLSLFDGMSCGQIALERSGVKINNYYASEIDKYAIKTTQKNYPDTIQVGDVRNIKAKDLPKIDLILAGSPCQGFSFSGKGLNFDDDRSKLFFEFVRLLKECNPIWWLLENVKMKKEWSDIISSILKIKPVLINSADFSAQNRERYYWTNITYKLFWKKSKQTLEDIIEKDVDEKYFIKPQRTIKILDKETEKGKIAFIGKDSQGARIYSIHGKAITINSGGGGLGAKTGLYAMPCLTPDRINKRQNGRRFKSDNDKSYTLTSIDKHGVLLALPIQGIDRTNKTQEARRIKNNSGVLILQKQRGFNNGGIKAENGKTPSLTSSCWENNNHLLDLFEGRIRKLTPIECERLQTVKDNYTEGVSDSQRYKMLGNGWTVDVIAYLLQGLNTNEKK
jgi:DNA (cytosine-5)-methyltransferase 3A